MKLASVLEELTAHLVLLELKFALVGGIAASARGEPRFTRDVDVAVSVSGDAEAEQLLFQLGEFGYVIRATVEQEAIGRLATARLEHPSGVVCDLIFATCGVEQEIVADAEPLEVFEHINVPTATPEGLLAMKVLSATDQRPRDLEDIRALLHACPNRDEKRVQQLLALIMARGFDRKQDLLAKWAELKERFIRSGR